MGIVGHNNRTFLRKVFGCALGTSMGSLVSGAYASGMTVPEMEALIASVFVGVDSPLGPFYLGYGRAADGNQSAYVYLARP